MPRGKKELAEQIIPKLREVEVEVGRGKTVIEAIKKIGVTEQTYYRWKKQYGGLRIDQAKRMKDLEKENSRLKRLLADAELDKAILRPSSGSALPGRRGNSNPPKPSGATRARAASCPLMYLPACVGSQSAGKLEKQTASRLTFCVTTTLRSPA